MNRIPVTIGIVGHRDAIITEKHKKAIKCILNSINKQYPNSPVTIFSQLAIGADTEIAKIFLDVRDKEDRDYRLIAPIPYDLEYYKKTQFSTDEDLVTFNTLLKTTERHIVLNKLTAKTKATLKKNVDANLDELNEFYRISGEFVADSSIIFIALWDEKSNQLEGGSSYIVTFKKTGTYQKHISEQIFDQDGSLISIPCNRKGSRKHLNIKQNYFNILLQDTSIKKALEKIETLNVSILKTDQEQFDKSANDLFPKNEQIDTHSQSIRDYYSVADVQTQKFKKRYNLVIAWLFLLGFVIFGVFESYKHLGLSESLFFSIIALVAIAYGLYKISFKWKDHKNFIENRVLTEALRIQFFWNIRKLRDSVSNYIIRIHKKEYYWTKHILTSIYGLSYPDSESIEKPTSIVKKYWIDDQVEYFSKNVKELGKKEITNRIISYIVFAGGLILLFGIFCINRKYEHLHNWLDHLITIDSIIFGIFALIKAYYEKKGYDQIKAQYSLMESIYIASSQKIDEIDTLNEGNKDTEMNKILLLVGKEAVIENGNWYMVYKEKEPEIEGIG